jgi:hypothetical protein
MDEKEFSTGAILSLTTGVLLGKVLGEMHEAAEFVAGHSIWTHEFAEKELWDKLKQRVFEQHPQLSEETGEGVNEANWQEYRDQCVQKYGPTLRLVRGASQRGEHPLESLARIAPDKPVIILEKKP